MAVNPVASNIISSLGIKGAVSGVPAGLSARRYAGFVPVLDEDGRICVDFIPTSVIDLKISPVSSTVVVDPNTAATERTGSIAAPYKSIGEAAENMDRSVKCAMLLMTGEYKGNENAIARFRSSQQDLYLIGVGQCRLASSLTLTGVNGANVFLQDISTSNSITVQSAAQVFCLGRVYIGDSLNVGQSMVRLSDEARVSSVDSDNISYLSEDAYIGNTSEVRGKTLKDALNQLKGRKIKIDKVDCDSRGFFVDQSCEDVSAESFGSFDGFDLRNRYDRLVAGLNRMMSKMENPDADVVTANAVAADVMETKELKTDALVLGDVKIGVDNYGYVIVDEGDSSDPDLGSGPEGQDGQI